MAAIITLISIHLGSDPDFQQQFRLWRGIGFFILYLWVVSIASHLYNYKRLNESLIFDYEESLHYKKTGLGIACFFSLVYTVLFVLYVMGKSHIHPDRESLTYFPAALWVLLALYACFSVFFSKPFRHILKSCFLILAVPASLIQAFSQRIEYCQVYCSKLATSKLLLTFPTIWATEQLISLLIPITDSIYTFAYYSEGQEPASKNDILKITEILALIIFAFRFL